MNDFGRLAWNAAKRSNPELREGECLECKGPAEPCVVLCPSCSAASRDRLAARREAEDAAARERMREAGLAQAIATIPAKYQWATFDAPELLTRVKSRAAIEQARAAITAERVLLVGGAGVGKTSLACAMLRSIIEAGRRDASEYRRSASARFSGAYWIAKARGEHRLGDGEAPVIREALRASVLVIDDLGIEQAKNTALSEVIYERHAEEMPTIVTTGFGFEALAQRYGDGIARRLAEGAKVIRCGTATNVRAIDTGASVDRSGR